MQPVPDDVARKIDEPLRSALTEPTRGDVLRVILRIGGDEPDRPDWYSKSKLAVVSPKMFNDRKEYRKWLIDEKRSVQRKRIGGLLQRLKKIGLKATVGELVEVAIVEGAAGPIMRAIGLPEILRATLDRSISLERPMKSPRSK